MPGLCIHHTVLCGELLVLLRVALKGFEMCDYRCFSKL